MAPPAQISSLDYQAELNAIKNAQSRLTADQRKAIDYWSRGGVLRWNEILLGLVARYNLPPAPNADDTIRFRTRTTRSPIRSFRSAIHPMRRGPTAMCRSRSSRR